MTLLHKTTAAACLLVAGLALFTAGCERDEVVRVYTAPKDPPRPAVPAPPIAWTVPPGWKQLPAGQMRYAAYGVSEEHPDVVLTVVPLPPSPLLANVNRWENQLGLPHSSEQDLNKVVTHIDTPTAHVDVVDLLGPEKRGEERQRMLGAVVPEGEQRTWFFKLSGPEKVVSAQKENFDAFIRSVRLATPTNTGEAAHASPPAPPAATPSTPPSAGGPHAAPSRPGAGKLARWTAPPDWTQDPQPRAMRTLSYLISSPQGKAEVAVFHLPARNAQQSISYINIWRQEVGLGPAQDFNVAGAPKVTVGGADGALLEFAGPEGAAEPDKRALVATAVRGQDIWFFKLSGDAPVVAAQRDPFQKFLASVQFGG